ncbi:MAG: efflux RND transporter permease subunit, partial [Candidatus Eremiobacteraeota bacterium]|nr:efflux RND transporter permease subunit [Candidatus Eremiobacteraeota bacterium]
LLKNEHGSGEGGGTLARRYEPVLRYALGHRSLVFLGAGLVLVVTFVLLRALPSDFLPKMDEGKFEMAYKMPTGTTLAATDLAASTIERIMIQDPAVAADGRITGIDTNGYSPTQPNTGTIRITLKNGKRDSYEEIAKRLRDKINAAVPAADLDFHQILEDQLNDLSGSPSPIEISLVGPDQAKLIEYADKLTDSITKIKGVTDPFDGVTYDDPTRSITPAQAHLAQLGVGSTELADALAARTQGTVATQVSGGVTLIPVRVRVGSALGSGDISSQSLTTKGGLTSIGALAGIGKPVLASEVNEQNSQRLVRVVANIENVPLSAVIEKVKRSIAELGLPPGYSARIGGQYEAQQASFGEFMTVLAVAVVLVFAVMLATFGSFRLPMVILMTIPLALIGVALGLFATGTPFNVSSFMGLLMLVGIVVKNGILLIDVANKRRMAGDDVTSALVVAGKTRLRPIVMTTLAAIGGLFPLALGLGSGSEMEKPLAIAVIGGLSTSTLFTLVVIPVLYAAFSGTSRRRSTVRRTVVATTSVLLMMLAALPGPGGRLF